MLARSLSFMAAKASLMLALGVVAGLALPEVAGALRPLLTPSVFLLLFLALLRIEWSRFSEISRKPVPILLGGLWLMLGAPVVMWAAGRSLGLDASVLGAMVLAAGAPPLMSSPAFALILGLDATLAVIVLLLATLSAPFTLAFTDQFLSVAQGASNIDLLGPLAAMVGGAAGAAQLTPRIVGHSRHPPYPHPVSGH